MARKDEQITCAGGGDIPEPDPLEFELCYAPVLDSCVIGRFVPEDGNGELVSPAVVHEAGFAPRRACHVDRDDDWPFQSFGRVNRDQRDGLLLGVRSSLDLAARVFPIGAHVGSEGAQTTNVVGARHLKKDIGVGERAVGSCFETLAKLGANVQEHIRRRTGEHKALLNALAWPAIEEIG